MRVLDPKQYAMDRFAKVRKRGLSPFEIFLRITKLKKYMYLFKNVIDCPTKEVKTSISMSISIV